jgi:KaiC/GvpD/RAD55 family RecA-like ATPase
MGLLVNIKKAKTIWFFGVMVVMGVFMITLVSLKMRNAPNIVPLGIGVLTVLSMIGVAVIVRLMRVSTGIPKLDKLTGGGFEKGSINMIAGGAGSGKTILAAQFAVSGILKHNEPAVFVSFGEKKEGLYRHLANVGINLQKLESEGRFVFLRYSPHQAEQLIKESFAEIRTIVHKIGAKSIVFDSITAFELFQKDEFSKHKAVLALFDSIINWGCTALVVSESGKKIANIEDSLGRLEFAVDSIILIHSLIVRNERKHLLEVLKMRGTNHSKKVYPFRITDKGIEL